MSLGLITIFGCEPDIRVDPTVIYLTGRGEQEMLTGIDRLSRLDGNRQQLTGQIARKCNVPRTRRLSHEDWHAHKGTLPCALHRHHPDVDGIFLPQQNMVSKV